MSNFRIVKNASVWWPVKWPEPADGGVVVMRQIELKFRRFKIDEIPDTSEMTPVDAVKTLATDWRGIDDEDGKPLAFNDAAITEWTAWPHVPAAIGDAYRSFLQCLPETRLGNSEASPDGGAAAGAATADPAAMPTP